MVGNTFTCILTMLLVVISFGLEADADFDKHVGRCSMESRSLRMEWRYEEQKVTGEEIDMSTCDRR
jgi:hypothetical protein